MRRRKQSRQMKKASVSALVKRIDGVIDAYEKSGRGIVSISFSPEGKRLAAMLKELEKYHPLDVRVRQHGNKLYQRLFWYLPSSVDTETPDRLVSKKPVCSIFSYVQYLHHVFDA